MHKGSQHLRLRDTNWVRALLARHGVPISNSNPALIGQVAVKCEKLWKFGTTEVLGFVLFGLFPLC